MNQTTESQAPSTTKARTLQTIIVWCIILACGIIIPNLFFRIYDTSSMGGLFLSPFPWVNVGGITINHGLTMCSGKIPELPTITIQVSCLVSILTVFVISPTLFLFGVRTRAAERASGKALQVLRWSTIQFVLGGMVLFVPALGSIPMAMIQRSVSSSLHESQATVENQDAIMYELNSVACKLYEYRVLPKELGGGNGSFAGFTLPKDLASTTEAQYEIEQRGADAIVKATSVKYPPGTITARISSKGQFLEWKYSGVFD